MACPAVLLRYLPQRQPGEWILEALPVRGIELIETGSLQLTLALIEQGLAQAGVGHEVRIGGYQLLGQRTGLLEEVPIVGEAGQGQIRQARLASSQHLARPPKP